MIKYIAKRLVHLVPVIIIISFLIFTINEMMPGDPVNAYLGEGSQTTPEQRQQIRRELGLDKGFIARYINWVKRAITFDFGKSIKYRAPVKDVIGKYIMNSFYLNIISLAIAFAIAIPVGIRSAVNKYGLFDNFWTLFSLIGVSIPSFFLALILIFYIAVPVDWIPLNGMRTVTMAAKGYDNKLVEVIDVLKHMILPVTVLTITSLASLIRYVRNSVIEVINQDYIRTARSKGLGEKVVMYRHAFRNALTPIVTLLCLYIPSLFAGSILLETVFIWPGIGNMLYTSILDRDFSMVMAANVFYAILMLIGNLLADVSYAIIDPRIKTE